MTTDIPTGAIPTGYMQDAKGRMVPDHLVRATDKLEDQLVKKMLGYAGDLSDQIARFRQHCEDDIAAFLALLADEYGMKPKPGAKGNMTFSSFDGLTKVQVQVADNLTFGPELQIAKGLIDECIDGWSVDARPEIRALVDHAFRVDKEGEVSRTAIFSLRRVAIEDERWQRAMQAIADSVRVQGSKSYIRFYRRKAVTDPWTHITIDLASAGIGR